jgi:ArsR family transcriptional regulator, virulence genes transcriptional regulator
MGAAIGLRELEEKAGEAEHLLGLLANRRRLIILCALMQNGEMSVGDILARLDLTQSALSQHLALMREADIVVTRRESTTIFYSIRDERISKLIGAIKSILCPDME